MKSYVVTFLSICCFSVPGQVKNYFIASSPNLPIYPYKVHNSNDGNLLLSNSEPTTDVGFSHILKVKPNGDTIFIKSSDSRNIYITSNGNILTNAKDFDVLTQRYVKSYLTMYDRNYNKKWQLDLSDNSLFFPNSVSSSFIQGFYITNIFEITNNHFKILANATSVSIGGPFIAKIIFDVDSLGNITTNGNLDYTSTTNEFINNTKDQISGFYNSLISCYNANTNTSKELGFSFTGETPIFKSGIFINNKMYVVGALKTHNNTYNKAVIACLDTSANISWCKVIVPNDSTVNNEITEIINVNNKILLKYQSDTSSYILNIDTLGQQISSYQTDNDITNFVYLNNDLYTSRIKFSLPQSFISLVKMDSVGNYLCAIPSVINISNYPLTVTHNYNHVWSGSIQITYTLTNQLPSPSSYTIDLTDGCDIVTNTKEKGINESNFSVYPNPTNSILNIRDEQSEFQNLTIEIKNYLSQTFYLGSYISEINISDFPNGVYFLVISTGQSSKVVKFIKE